MDFGQSYVTAVETALENQPNLRGRWQRLTTVTSNSSATALKPITAWSIELPQGTVLCPGVSQLWVVLDAQFPYSQPRVIAPSIREDGTWPHVEDEGVLCLGTSLVSDDAGSRVLQHLNDAIALLNYNDAKCQSDFQAEVITYWTRGDDVITTPKHWSLVKPTGPSREVKRYFNTKREIYVWGNSKEELVQWLRNAGYNPSDKEIEPAWIVWLEETPTPLEFPKVGRDVLIHIPTDMQQKLIRPGIKLPVLVGASTSAGSFWVGAELDIASKRELEKGFRPGRFPFDKAFNSMASRKIRRFSVERIDGSYVHGRDHNESYDNLSKVRVALIGCGSLGSAIARLLAQAGVGRFVLIDPDEMKAHNTSRHVVGSSRVGMTKVNALAISLQLDFPHQGPHMPFKKRIELLTAGESELAKCDVIISAGIDLPGDMALTHWRLATEIAPPHICTWVEQFALAGHAVALFEKDNLGKIFDENGQPAIRMTSWPSSTAFREAGCGNTFQPHGAIDLQRTALTAANLCIEVLQGSVDSSILRTWQGDLEKVKALGGTPSKRFDRSNIETTLTWAKIDAVEASQ